MNRNDYLKNRAYWLRRMGLLPEAPAADASKDVPGPQEDHEHPRCARCGGQPNLGRCAGDGKIVPMCRPCADEEWLEMLSDEERKILRGFRV